MCHHDEIPCWMSKHPPLRRDVRPGGSGSTLARLAEVQYDSSYVAALNLIQVKCPKLIRNDKSVEVTQRTLIKRVGMSTLCQKRTFDSYSITAWDKKTSREQEPMSALPLKADITPSSRTSLNPIASSRGANLAGCGLSARLRPNEKI